MVEPRPAMARDRARHRESVSEAIPLAALTSVQRRLVLALIDAVDAAASAAREGGRRDAETTPVALIAGPALR